MKNSHYAYTERGSVIIWILVAIALFASLSFAFNKTSKNSVSLLTDEQAKASANQIIAYGNDVKQAVKRLQLRGCDDTEVSFQNNVVTTYVNPNSPAHCLVFDASGGGLNWQNQPPSSISPTYNGFNDYVFQGNNVIANAGNFVGELIMNIVVNEQVCEKINLALNNTPAFPPVTDPNGFHFGHSFSFRGNYTTAAGLNAYPFPITSGCFFDGSTGNLSSQEYVYYKVIIVR